MPNHQSLRTSIEPPPARTTSDQQNNLVVTPRRNHSNGDGTSFASDPLLTAEDVAKRLIVSTDWVWDHSSRKKPYLPVIRMGDGTLRYRTSAIEAFIDERERTSSFHRRAR